MRRPSTSRVAMFTISLAVAPAISFTGCATSEIRGGPSYPADRERLRALDIQAFRDSGSLQIRLTNTSAMAFGPSRLWLNSWYSAAIESLDVGETVELPIGMFRDEHGERIRGGGFFATRAPEPVVIAELETDEGLHPIVYVPALER